MEEIVIVVSKGENRSRLIEWIKALFPECEVHTVTPNGESVETDANDSSSGEDHE